MKFVSKQYFQDLFIAIDSILAESDLNNVSIKALTKSLCKNGATARYVKQFYPKRRAIYKIIYDRYNSPETIWENSKGDKACLAEPMNKSNNRWHEFTKFMLLEKES